MRDSIEVRFDHGLGDCVYFAHQVPLYRRRRYEVTISCRPDKRLLFSAAGARLADIPRGHDVPWHEAPFPAGDSEIELPWQWSKWGRNVSVPPMPDIGWGEALWDEYCSVHLDASPHVPFTTRESAARFAAGLPRPLILLHTHGNTDQQRKNIPIAMCSQIYRRLLEASGGMVLLLDWDNRMPRVAHWSVRHVEDAWKRLDTGELLALIAEADLLIGIDSGPLHAARFTRTPSIGLWINGGSPVSWSLPRAEQVNLVAGNGVARWRRSARIPFQICECSNTADLPAALARLTERMLGAPRYLTTDQRAADVQLQQFVRDWLRGDNNAFGGYTDRDRSFDLLLRLMSSRFASPRVIETGSIRRPEDFAGAGFSTYVLGAYLSHHGGRLISLDCNPAHCGFARSWTQVFGPAVWVVESDSASWLEIDSDPVDVLLLDSVDTSDEGAPVYALRELQAAYPRMHGGSVVVFDDTVYWRNSFQGIGALAVPWLLARGWHVLFSGHQTMLSKTEQLDAR